MRAGRGAKAITCDKELELLIGHGMGEGERVSVVIPVDRVGRTLEDACTFSLVLTCNSVASVPSKISTPNCALVRLGHRQWL